MITDCSATLTYAYVYEQHGPTISVTDFEKPAPRANVDQSSGQESDVSTSVYGEFTPHVLKLKAIQRDRTLWPAGADGPNEFAAFWAQATLQTLQGMQFPPTVVVASAEGGVGICFVASNNYADIEFLNSGTILAVTSNRRDRPVAWEVEQDAGGLARAIARIRRFIRPSKA